MKMTLSPARASGMSSAPGARHWTSAGILRVRTKVWMAPAVTLEPFQHPRLALEVSRRGAMDLASRRKMKTKNARMPRSSGERLPRWRRSTRVRDRSGSRARRRSHECAGELGAEQQWRAQEREAEEEEGVCQKE